jgi:arylformamidase
MIQKNDDSQYSSQWIDISVPLCNAMVTWPTQPPVRIERCDDMGRGDICNQSTVSMSIHTGTHMDAPLHFVREGISINRIPLDIAVGPARVIEIQDTESIKPQELVPHHIRHGERILLKTQNSRRSRQTNTFIEDFVFISEEAARFLVECGVSVVGVDYISVAGFKSDPVKTHQILLEAGIWLIEWLDLSDAEPGNYELICLPLRIDQGDGAPARAILRPI